MFTRCALPRPTWRAFTAPVTAILCPILLAAALLAPGAAVATPGLSTVRLAAGHRVVDHYGHVWGSDTRYARGGKVTRTTHHISGTATQRLYRSERVGTLSYRIKVTPGYYRVTLGMAEQVFAKTDQRVYALAAEGTTRLARVAANRSGRWHVYSVTVRVKVSDGVLDLLLSPRRHAAAVSTILVSGYARLPAPTKAPSTHPSTTAPAPSTSAPRTTAPVSSTAPSSSAPVSSTAPSSSAPVSSTAPSSSAPVSSTAPSSLAPVSSTAPTTSAAPIVSSAPVAVVTPQQFGAVGDGVADDTAALQRAFDQAAGREVLLPAGRIYRHTAVLHLRTAGLHVSGPGELLATNEQQSSVWIEADNVLLDGGLLVKTVSTQRWGAWEQMGIRLDGHAGITLRNVTVVGSAAAGIYVGGATHGFLLDHVVVQNTRADGIHMTEGAYAGSVISPTVSNSGDDGVAIVSYSQDGTPCHDITVTSPRVLGTTWGRGISVVGGTNITETGIDVERTSAAGVYIGSEGSPWFTAAPSHVTIAGGKIVGANTDTTVDHGAVLVLSGETNVTPANIVVRSLTITGTRASASRDLGVITYGTTPANILFSGITITGGPTSAYQGNTPQSAFQLRSIVQNGVRLPDAG